MPTLTFTANPSEIQSGGRTTVSWSTTNATSCTPIPGTSGATTGEVSYTLTENTTFPMTCIGPGGSVTRVATVTVNSPILWLEKPAFASGETFSAAWNNTGTTYPLDWVGITTVGGAWGSAGAEQGKSWFYTGGTVSGSKPLQAPNSPGQYEILYYSNNTTDQVLERISMKVIAPTPLAVSPTAPFSCQTKTSSPSITVEHDGQIIEHVSISADGAPGIDTNGHSNITIRDVTIHHKNGSGIKVSNSNNVTIQNVDIINDTAPASDIDPHQNDNIACFSSSGLHVTNARLIGGSDNMRIYRCADLHLQYIEGHNVRNGGGVSGGLFASLNDSSGVLEDFSTENDPVVSASGDNINLYNSANIIVRRGLVDGNNSVKFDLNGGDYLNGWGVAIDNDTHDVLVEDVDVINQSLGCFGVWGAEGSNYNVTFNRTRCADNTGPTVRTDGRVISFLFGWAIHPNVKGSSVRASSYHGLVPENPILDYGNLVVPAEVTKADFVARSPQRVQNCSTTASTNTYNPNLASVASAFMNAGRDKTSVAQTPAAGAKTGFTYRFTLNLWRGQEGTEVRALQEALKAEGLYDAGITGGFFDRTKAAVMKFQEKYGINPTGYVGPATRAQLNALFSL